MRWPSRRARTRPPGCPTTSATSKATSRRTSPLATGPGAGLRRAAAVPESPRRRAAAGAGAGTRARSPQPRGHPPANQGAPGSVGLSLALGGVSPCMEELAALFTAFATDGAVRPLCETLAQCTATRPQAFIGPRSAAQVTAILAESPRPLPDAEDLPRVAFKTGTSARHRDAWAIGYDGQHVIAVWLGRATTTPPARWSAWLTRSPCCCAPSPGWITPAACASPRAACAKFSRAARPPSATSRAGRRRSRPLRLVFPTDEAAIPLAQGQLALRLSGGQRPFRLFVDGLPLARSISRPADAPRARLLHPERG